MVISGRMLFCLCLAGAVLCAGCVAGSGAPSVAGTWIPAGSGSDNAVRQMVFSPDGRFSESATNGNFWNGTYRVNGSTVTANLDDGRYMEFTFEGDRLSEGTVYYVKVR